MMARWSVYLIRSSRTQSLGTVTAANEKEAIREARKQFDIEPDRENRIVVTRISQGDD
jgi:1,2-phenylacetyl-CoA epoxidase PaaB subunit